MIDRIKDLQPQTVFVVMGLFFGIVFLLIIPPFQVPDEHSHFVRAFSLSEGTLFPEKMGGNLGIYVPKSLPITTSKFRAHLPNVKNIETLSILNLPLNQGDRIFMSRLGIYYEYDMDMIGSLGYPPLPYFASAFAMKLGELFGFSPLLLMYIGRLANLFLWIFLVYLAIKIAPIHKWVFFTLALMPMTLFQAASLSADSFVIGSSFLVIAFFLKLALDNDTSYVKRKDILMIILMGSMLILAKVGYAVFLLLFLLIPAKKFGDKKRKILNLIIVLSPIILIVGLWNYFFNEIYLLSLPHPIASSLQGQITFITSDPLNFINILTNTILLHWKEYLVMFVGNFGWIDIPLPESMVVIYLTILVLVAIFDNSHLKFSPKQKLITFFTSFLAFILIFIYEYLAFTPVGHGEIWGVQGRYLIPVAPLIFLLFYNQKTSIRILNRILRSKSSKNINLKYSLIPKLALISFVIIFLSVSVWIITLKYYYA